MARDEEKYKYRAITRFKQAQSTLEYALLLPFLFLIILGILELAFMWHKLNTLENVAREISANIALSSESVCENPENAYAQLQLKTKLLAERELTFSNSIDANSVIYDSIEQYKNNPIVRVKISCPNMDALSQSVAVQMQTPYVLHFFAASLPNYRTGERIILIPDNIILTSNKVVTLAGF